jgi:hypothetical protein
MYSIVARHWVGRAQFYEQYTDSVRQVCLAATDGAR